jgi:hypothetical protein
MPGISRFCSKQKGFRKRLIVECRKCTARKGCRTLQLYLDPEVALNFISEKPVNSDSIGILCYDVKVINGNAS